MPKDDILYKILGVAPSTGSSGITAAYRRRALEHHPDKAGRDQASQNAAREKFTELAEAYDVLKDLVQRANYDQAGYQHVMKRAPGTPTNADIAEATKTFADFVTSNANGADNEEDMIEDLLDWWSDPGTPALKPQDSLRTQTTNFYALLTRLYDQYRLTHSSTTESDNRGEAASTAILRVAEEHFGTANANQLRAWGESVEGASEDLNPSTDQKYYDVNSELQPTPTAPTIKNLASHGSQYAKLWEKIDEAAPQKASLIRFERTINWGQIAGNLGNLTQKPSSSSEITAYMIAKDKWKNDMNTHGFPKAWDDGVEDKIINKSRPDYKPSKWPDSRASVETDNGDENTED
ncbi:DnaJ molecular chaperone y domain [Friedmanniomyces endolithicus]|nr:DnaJ molecular chaperone y domain [Friedmanniomyces endolithicus]